MQQGFMLSFVLFVMERVINLDEDDEDEGTSLTLQAPGQENNVKNIVKFEKPWIDTKHKAWKSSSKS